MEDDLFSIRAAEKAVLTNEENIGLEYLISLQLIALDCLIGWSTIVTQFETEEANVEKPAELTRQVKRRGFMAGQIIVPDDFDRMASAEIEEMFLSPQPKI